MSKKPIDLFEVESPEQAVEIFCAHVVTFASRLYADTTATTGEPTKAEKTELVESLKSIEADNGHIISIGRSVLKMGLYKDKVFEVLSSLTGLGRLCRGRYLQSSLQTTPHNQ